MSEQTQWDMKQVVGMATKTIYPLNQLNVRDSPSANGRIVSNLAAFAPVLASENTVQGGVYKWHRIENGDKEAYVSSSVVTFTLEALPVPPVADDKERYIIDFKNETLIVDADHLEAVQEIFRNLYTRTLEAKLYEETPNE